MLVALLSGAAWGHEAGQQTADTSCLLSGAPQGLRLDYTITYSGTDARLEWGELDADHNGTVSRDERDAYLQREGEALGRDLELSNALGAPSTLESSGNSERLTLRCLWNLPAPAGAWRFRHPGARRLTGKHDYALVLSGQPLQREPAFQVDGNVPQIDVTPGFGSAPPAPVRFDWSWQQGGNDLQSVLSARSLWSGLLLAFFLGAIHGLTPGHGKSIVGAYLVGSRGTVGQALLLGLVVTFTHTFSVILLGVACLLLFKTYLPPSLIPWIGVASGLLIVGLGGALITGRVPAFMHHHHHDDDEPGQAHPLAPPAAGAKLKGAPRSVRVVQPHGHGHGHGHSHAHGGGHGHGAGHHHHHLPEKLSLGGLISLGVSGGMVPCPEALAVLLSALALNQLALGLLVLLAFSSGLAAVLVTIGIVMVSASRLLQSRYPSGRTIARLSQVSYCFMILMGLAITARNLWETGVLRR